MSKYNIKTDRKNITTDPVDIIPAGEVDQFLRLNVSATSLVSFTGEASLTNSMRVLANDTLDIPVGIIGAVSVRTASGSGLVYFAYS